MIEITFDSAVKAMQEAIELKGPKYVYINPDGQEAGAGAMCFYADTVRNAPSCAVGHVLHAHGVSIDDLRMVEMEDSHGALLSLKEDEVLVYENRAMDLLYGIQLMQDRGMTWADSLAESIRTNS